MKYSRSKALAAFVITAQLLLCDVVMAQNVLMYPDSKLVFFSSRSGTSAIQCPEGGDSQAFIRLVNANGWNIRTHGGVKTRTGAGSASEDIINQSEAFTVHPKENRMRRWLISTQTSIRRGPDSFADIQCQTTATLQGEVLNEALEVDIGIKLTKARIKRGEQVAGISLTRPFYCDNRWPFTPKEYGDFEIRSFDCSSIGLSPTANELSIPQTVNLPEKE